MKSLLVQLDEPTYRALNRVAPAAKGLSRRCLANCDNIRTVPRSALLEQIGLLAPRRRSELKRAVGHALAWDELIDAL